MAIKFYRILDERPKERWKNVKVWHTMMFEEPFRQTLYFYTLDQEKNEYKQIESLTFHPQPLPLRLLNVFVLVGRAPGGCRGVPWVLPGYSGGGASVDCAILATQGTTEVARRTAGRWLVGGR